MSTTTAKEAEGLTYQQLKDLLEKKKEAEIDKVTKELTAARGIVASLEAQLANLGVAPATATTTPAKRGRKPNRFKLNGAKPAKVKKGKRGKLGQSITDFLVGKGKAGAHVKDIAAHVGTKPVNITAWIYSTGKSKVKKVAPATFALKK